MNVLLFDRHHWQNHWFLYHALSSLLFLVLLLVGVSGDADNDFGDVKVNDNVSSSSSSPPHLVGHNLTQLTKLDCAMRQLAVEYAHKTLLDKKKPSSSLLSSSATTEQTDDDEDYLDLIISLQQQVHDALRIDALCGTKFYSSSSSGTSQGKDDVDVNISSLNNTSILGNTGQQDHYHPHHHTRSSPVVEDEQHNDDYIEENFDAASVQSDQSKLAKLKQECHPTNINGHQQQQTALCLFVLPSSLSEESDNGSSSQHQSNHDFSNSTTFQSIHDALAHVRNIRRRQQQLLRKQQHKKQEIEIKNQRRKRKRGLKTTNIDDQEEDDDIQPSSIPRIINIILRHGIHELQGKSIELTTHLDSGIKIIGYPGEDVWISGGIALPPSSQLIWKRWKHNPNVMVTKLPKSLFAFRRQERKGGDDESSGSGESNNDNDDDESSDTDVDNKETIIPKILSLFTTTKRYVRARYPNSNPELDQWGYASYNRYNYSISPKYNVIEWHKPPPNSNAAPTFEFYDFSHPNSNSDDRGIPIKNNSAQPGYNWYASGRGGVCSTVWGNDVNSYWCSNSSQGGWSEVDQECAISGRLQLPIGMTYNLSTDIGQRFHRWTTTTRKSNSSNFNNSCSAVGGILHAWHSQSWSMHMFEIKQQHYILDNSTTSSYTSSANGDSSNNEWFQFVKGGGRQGGRNWCRCDQCTYAGGWCGQHNDPPNNNDTRLISGSFYIENILVELDLPGEYYFDHNSLALYVYPNKTSTTITTERATSSGNAGSSSDDLNDFRIALLDRLITISSNVTSITIENVGFRDMAPTYMHDQWSAPSGGDWALHRGGSIFIENAANVTIRNCHFFRLDGNAIFLSRKTRDVMIELNIFEWLGENGVATWGDTGDPVTGLRGYDGTAGNFPINTTIQYNVFRELGIYQKQSSAVGQAKAALTTIRNNIMFNMPRAAINFNDMLGGGDVVEDNLIFNTCRESGDHGPINTWDRQAFLTTLRDGVTPSFDPLTRVVQNNFIFANYGASQGIDNDDGSSWHHISRNVFYMADGFKMDYGGHDSVFEDNVVLSIPYDGANCFNVANFLPGHGDKFRRNVCVLGLGNRQTSSGCGDPSCTSPYPVNGEDKLEIVGWSSGCNSSIITMASNQYFTQKGNPMIQCGNTLYSLEEAQGKFGLELGTNWSSIPDDEQTMVDWAKSVLFPPAAKPGKFSPVNEGDTLTSF